jgi:hypothetical protein
LLNHATNHTQQRCGAFKTNIVSYEIYFIKKKDLKAENANLILESAKPTESDELFVSKDLMLEIKTILKEKGLSFEVFESKSEDYIELNFPTYQISMFNSQIAISLPYWDSNSNDGINKEIKIITNVLIENGFTGFDPQTEQIINEKFEFQKAFTETKSVVSEHLNKNENLNDNNSVKYIGISLAIILIGIIVWRIIKK